MAYAVKIHLKKNAAANGLELKERLQGLTATDVTHSRKSKAAILIFHIWPHKYCENPPSQITKHRLLIKSRNKTGISVPSDLHSQVASLCFYFYSYYFFSFFFLHTKTVPDRYNHFHESTMNLTVLKPGTVFIFICLSFL